MGANPMFIPMMQLLMGQAQGNQPMPMMGGSDQIDMMPAGYNGGGGAGGGQLPQFKRPQGDPQGSNVQVLGAQGGSFDYTPQQQDFANQYDYNTQANQRGIPQQILSNMQQSVNVPPPNIQPPQMQTNSQLRNQAIKDGLMRGLFSMFSGIGPGQMVQQGGKAYDQYRKNQASQYENQNKALQNYYKTNSDYQGLNTNAISNLDKLQGVGVSSSQNIGNMGASDSTFKFLQEMQRDQQLSDGFKEHLKKQYGLTFPQFMTLDADAAKIFIQEYKTLSGDQTKADSVIGKNKAEENYKQGMLKVNKQKADSYVKLNNAKIKDLARRVYGKSGGGVSAASLLYRMQQDAIKNANAAEAQQLKALGTLVETYSDDNGNARVGYESKFNEANTAYLDKVAKLAGLNSSGRSSTSKPSVTDKAIASEVTRRMRAKYGD